MECLGIKFSGAKLSSRLLLLSVALGGSSLLVLGQTAKPTSDPKATPAVTINPPITSDTRTNVDETFELNIVERRYSQENFEASTAVGIQGGADNLNLQIGVALASGRIEVLLRNVRGTVRFRGTLDRILEVIGNRSPAAPAAVSPAPLPRPSPE